MARSCVSYGVKRPVLLVRSIVQMPMNIRYPSLSEP